MLIAPMTRRCVQDSYGGRILYTPEHTGGDGSGGQSAGQAAAAPDGARPAPEDSLAQPAQVPDAEARSALAAPAADGAEAPASGQQPASNGVHSPDEEQTGPAATAAADQQQSAVQEQPLSTGGVPSPGNVPGLRSPSQPRAQPGAAPQQQQPQQQQGQDQQQGQKQQSVVFDGHDLSPGTQMLHVGDEVEFMLVYDRAGSDPRATRVRSWTRFELAKCPFAFELFLTAAV